MEISKPLLDIAIDQSKASRNEAARANPPGPVSKEKAVEVMMKFHEPTPGFALFATPDEDMAKVEDLLGLEPSSLGTYYVKTDERHQYCKCGRRGNFYDVVKTAVDGKTHGATFLRDVLTGKYGSIVNTNSHQRCDCAGCGTELAATKFLSTGPSSRASVKGLQVGGGSGGGNGGGTYYFPVYTHRF